MKKVIINTFFVAAMLYFNIMVTLIMMRTDNLDHNKIMLLVILYTVLNFVVIGFYALIRIDMYNDKY